MTQKIIKLVGAIEMDQIIKELIVAAKAAQEQAYAPYSGFQVGAAALSHKGKIYSGCNVENASFGLTICAERNALFRMVSQGDRVMDKMLLLAPTDKPTAPCGACLQVIAEFSHENTQICLMDKTQNLVVKTVKQLLPESFELKK